MDVSSFQAALASRVTDMADACTGCGQCVRACPGVGPSGIGDASPETIIGGVLDLLRNGDGPEASRKWALSCMLSGECITACDDGVNPRFLLAMARLAIAQTESKLPQRRRRAVEAFRELGQDVSVLSRLQLGSDMLERLGQQPAAPAASSDDPEFVFYTGCNVLKTPHIALLALDIMDALGMTYRVMGGPTHCCGVVQMRMGDAEMSGRMGSGTIDKLARTASGQVISWCPSCFVHFTETVLPAIETQGGSRPFEMTPFMRVLRERLHRLAPLLIRRVEMRVALHRHPGIAGAMEAAKDILDAVPGVEIVDLEQPAVGLQSATLGVLPNFKRELQLNELEAASKAGVDALVAVYHSDHRELCAHERDWPFRIINILEIVGASMGLYRDDTYKRLKVMQDADQIVVECQDLMAEHSLDAATARRVVMRAMLGDQPLGLGRPVGPRPHLE